MDAGSLGSLGGYIGQMLGRFGVTLGICRRIWMTFGSLWGHFGVMMCICGGLEGPFSISSLPASIFWRVKGDTGNLNPAAIRRAGPTFGGPVGSLVRAWRGRKGEKLKNDWFLKHF